MSHSLWGGRFSGAQDDFFFSFNESFSFDQRLFFADVWGSKAYAKALCQRGIFNSAELERVLAALSDLEQDVESHPELLTQAMAEHFEDIHSYVESKLTLKVGELGKRLHTGRSRNDQVATDLRIFLRSEVEVVQMLITALQGHLIELSDRYPHAVMPGYTHLQKAQPILFSHYLLSFFEMLKRDFGRMKDLNVRLNYLPLGSGALSGNSMGVDRHFLAQELGFSGVAENSLDAVSDRDFVVEFLSAASLIMVHLSRLAEDLIIYSSDEFRFVVMGDQVSTGSSLMPQKKNPDALELIRGKTGRVIGHQMALLTTLKGLPSCYNKDLQEDKEALFDGLDQVKACLKVMGLVLTTLKVDTERLKFEAQQGYMNATDLADYLVNKGVAFRSAHKIVGEIVLHAIKCQKSLNELPLSEYQKFHTAFNDDVYTALNLDSVLAKKASPGGTHPERVREAMSKARASVGQ